MTTANCCVRVRCGTPPLSLPVDEVSQGEVHHHEAAGPANTQLLIAERRILLDNRDVNPPARAAVAVDLNRVSAAHRDFAKELGTAL